jgi:hypothetical protein
MLMSNADNISHLAKSKAFIEIVPVTPASRQARTTLYDPIQASL